MTSYILGSYKNYNKAWCRHLW